MSIRSKFNEDEIRKLDKEKYMNNSSFDDIMQYSDMVFDVQLRFTHFCTPSEISLSLVVRIR